MCDLRAAAPPSYRNTNYEVRGQVGLMRLGACAKCDTSQSDPTRPAVSLRKLEAEKPRSCEGPICFVFLDYHDTHRHTHYRGPGSRRGARTACGQQRPSHVLQLTYPGWASALRSVCNFMGWAITVYTFVKLHLVCNVTPCNFTV